MRKSFWISATLPATLALLTGCAGGKNGTPIAPNQPTPVPISKVSIAEQSTASVRQPAATEPAPPPATQFAEPPQPAVEVTPPQPTVIPPPSPLQLAPPATQSAEVKPAPQPTVAAPPASPLTEPPHGAAQGSTPPPTIPAPGPQQPVGQQPPPLINPTGAPAELPANPTVDQVLDALDQRGKSMREFTAKVSLTDGEEIQGDLSTRVGRVLFQKTDNDNGKLRVTFDKRIDGKTVRNELSEYKLEDRFLVERNYRRKTQTTREVVQPGGKLNLLKLGEGPFPLPIGQKKEEMHEMFNVTEIPPTAAESKDKDLADTIHITLVPKPGSRFSRRFGAIDVWVDRKSNFPVQIHTQRPDESSPEPHTTKLQDLQINPPGGLKEGDFALPKIDEQAWSLTTERYKE